MKVGLLGLSDDYNKRKGQGIQRYMHEVYTRMKAKSGNLTIEKTGCSRIFPVIGAGLSFMLGNMLFDFNDYKIIHNMDQKPLLPLKKGKALVVTTAHDFQPILAPECNDTGIKERIWQPIIDYGMRRSIKSDHMIARSSLTRNDAMRLGYDRKRITVINDGVDERYFSPKENSRHSRFTVGYMGAFRKRKNVRFAIDAVGKIEKQDLSFEIWGKTEFEYGHLVKSAGSDRRIKFMGFAPEDRLVQIYDRFDAFVFPSLYEGFGLPIIEAQARGLPVIIYREGRIPEEVRRHCLKADGESHMAQIIEDLKENGYDEKLKKKATEYARSFTWEREAEETLRLYRKLIKNA